MTNVYIDEQDVSVQLSERPPLSTTWNQRPVAGSWYCAYAATSFRSTSISSARRGLFAGAMSSTSRVAIPNQPPARHPPGGDWPVLGSAQDWVRDSSYACRSKPFDC